MKKQILMIHGADSYSDYERFLDFLRTWPIQDPLDQNIKKRWKTAFKEELTEKGYEVYAPSMPNRDNAKYIEWKIWFERYFEFLHDGVILLGHSQGGYFLAKYLTENKMPLKIKALYLLAAPFEPDDFGLPAQAGGEDGGDFRFDTNKLSNLEQQVSNIFIFHSEDDSVVPYAHASKYVAALSSAEMVSFKDRDHFIGSEFPELLENIYALNQ